MSATDLTTVARHDLRLLLLDSISNCLLALRYVDQSSIVPPIGGQMGGHGRSTALGACDRSGPAGAAFVNGALLHALNFDAYAKSGGPVGIAAVPAALAVAEDVGGVSGLDLLSAMAAGSEVANRLSRACRAGRPKRGIGHAGGIEGQLLGYFGSAASVARVLNLDLSQTHSAFGFALMQAAGSAQVMVEGDVPAKAFYGGLSAQGGVVSGLLGAAGIDASCDAFGGSAGLFMRYFPTGSPQQLTDDFDKEGFAEDILFKRWPVSSMAFPFVAAAVELRGRARFDVQRVRAVRLHVEARAVPWVEPLRVRREPQTAAAAANSAIYAVAVALVYGDLAPLHLTPAVREDARILTLTNRTTYDLTEKPEATPLLRVTFERPNEVMVVRAGRGVPGSLSSDEVISRFFRTCAEVAPGDSNSIAARVWSLVDDLEDLDDCRRLGDLLHELGPQVVAHSEELSARRRQEVRS